MAASLRTVLTLSTRQCASKILRSHRAVARVPRRFLLSEAYSCNEAWRKQLEDPAVKQVSLSEFAFQVRDELEKTGRASAVDVNVLAHLLQHMEEEDEVEFMEDILHRFSHCQDCLPRSDSTSHAVVRSYIAAGQSARLPALLADRLHFGILPNHYTLNLLMDYFIRQERFAEAVQVAYCSTIQEDFSNPINAWLALHACTQRLLGTDVDDLAPPPPEASDGEEDWIKVKYIRYPYYDDHMDIKDERFLLGKTLLMIGNTDSIDVPSDVRNSLKVIGSGLYHKFARGLARLKDIAESTEGNVLEQALEYFSQSLDKVEAREADEPEVEIALRTMDDEIRKLLPTREEKEEFVEELGRLRERLVAQGRVVSGVDLGQSVLDMATASVQQFESAEISQQEALFKVWGQEQQMELDRQMAEYRKKERIEEMKQQVKELQEQEELLTYFDFEENIRLKFLDEDRATDQKLTISK
ncbi:28S ribosomal protein S27, mitochondrial [Aplysia californica]|uniref:28S ribosomal protein S27, mitochondrial n=1 Tax=Aplysia californica TaxID=6500 RepID=A0ABM0JNS8_APLCA|nr:28S ribosomal protein S27, mitochondrial [Aplysia californica]